MTIVILSLSPAGSQPWGWWDEEDSIARPTAPRDSFGEATGRLRIDAGTGTAGSGRVGYDAACRAGSWQAVVAGRADSGSAPTRQRANWRGYGAVFEAGDLVPWQDDPLLEGGSRRSGSNHPMRWIGSGQGVSGVDAQARDAQFLPWAIEVRSRNAVSTRDRSRSSLLLGGGPLRGGIGVSSSGPRLGYAGLRLADADAALDASLVVNRSSRGFLIASETATDATRHQLSIRQVDRELDHDGLPVGWAGSSQARCESRWRSSSSSAGIAGEFAYDAGAERSTRLLGDISHGRCGLDGRMRARWVFRDDEDILRLTPGLARSSGRLRPWFELPWTRGRGFAPSLGLRWRGRDLHTDVAATRSVEDRWSWRASSSLGRERTRGGSRLEIAIGGERDIEKGEGSWVTSW